MEQFLLTPNEAVWRQVEMRIKKERKRRTAGRLFLAALLIILAGGATWFMKSSSEQPVMSNHQNTFSKRQSPANAEHENKYNRNVDKENINHEPNTAAGRRVTRSVKTDQQVGLKKSGNRDNVAIRRIKVDVNKPGVIKKDVQNDAGKLTFAPGNEIVHSTPIKTPETLPPHKYLITNKNPEPVNNTLNNAKPAELNKETSSNKAVFAKNELYKGRQKWEAGLALFAGISDNIKGVGLPAAKALNDVLYASPGTVQQGSLSSRAIYRLQYKAGFSFRFGINMHKSIGKRWNFSAGVDYHYLSARSRVSSKKDSTFNIYDSVLMKTTFVNGFYINGESTNFSNKYHILEFPAVLHYRVNNNNKKQLQLFAGIAPGFVINTSALYLNTKAGIFYKEKDQFNSFHLSAQTGLLFTLKNAKKYQINTGPVTKFGLTDLSKTITHNNQHLFFTGLKTNINLK